MQDTRRQILEAIASGPVSGPELADRLDRSRAAVWKHVKALREDGFEIESGDGGYRLVSVPEYGGPAIQLGLDAPFDIEFHERLESTNDRARERAAGGAANVVVCADEQTGGRGRLGREWASPTGGIWMSLVLRPSIPPTEASLFTLAAGVAVARSIETVGVTPTIKWPNDVLVGDRKVAGILTEMEAEADRVRWLVIGIGINANVDTADLPPEATSLHAERGEPVDRREIVQTCLQAFDDLRSNPETITAAWRDRAGTIGRTVRVETPRRHVTGTAVDVTDTGALVIDEGDTRTTVTAGDCEHLRPEER